MGLKPSAATSAAFHIFLCSVFPLPSARTQKHLQGRRRELIPDSWLHPGGVTGNSESTPVHFGSSSCCAAWELWRNFPGLDPLLSPAHKPIVSYIKDFQVWKTGICKIFSFSLLVSLNWLSCRGCAGGGLSELPAHRQLLKLPCFVQLQPKSRAHCSL